MKREGKELTPENIRQFKDAVVRAAREKEVGGNKDIEKLLEKIKIGDRVRCFVFFGEKSLKGNKANYFEGKVLSKNIGKEEVRVRIEKEVVGGMETTDQIGNDIPVAASPDVIEKLEDNIKKIVF